MGKKLLLKIIAAYLALALILPPVYSLLAYPLTIKEAESMRVGPAILNAQAVQDAVVLVQKQGDGFEAIILQKSLPLHRYRIQERLQYADAFTTLAKGSRNYLALELQRDDIRLTVLDAGRLDIWHHIVAPMMLMAVLIYLTFHGIVRRRRKRQVQVSAPTPL